MLEEAAPAKASSRPLMTGMVPRELRKTAGTLVARDSPGLARYGV